MYILQIEHKTLLLFQLHYGRNIYRLAEKLFLLFTFKWFDIIITKRLRMKKLLALFFFTAFVWSSEDSILINAANTLDRFMAIPEERIPPKLLSRAQAIAIIPNLIRAGFVAGARYGKGVLFFKQKDNWSDPIFIKMYGASLGWQIGLESIDVILVFVDRSAASKVLQNGITLAADTSIAVGPVGRAGMVGAATKFKAQIYSYSRSMGAYIGVALAGSTLEIDYDANQRFYGCDPQKIYSIINGECNKKSEFVRILKNKLREYSSWQE